jgi:multicomponent K+:H+ antiporter subunit E
MKLLRFPLLWSALLLMWLVLNDSVSPGHILLGIVIATFACWAVAPVAPARPRARHLGTIAILVGLFVRDVVRSNIAVLRLIVSGRTARSAFVDVPLELTQETGLAILACIVTATPGSAWIQHNSKRNVVTIHVLDTDDAVAWVDDFKRTYERRLVEILQ